LISVADLAGGKSFKILDIKVSTKSEFFDFDLGSMSLSTPLQTMVCDVTTVNFHAMALRIMTVGLAGGFQHLK